VGHKAPFVSAAYHGRMSVKTLNQPADADALIDGQTPAWIYIHSATCPVSSRTRKIIDRYAEEFDDQPVGKLVVQDHRDVSDHIAERTGVRHETPQVLLVKDGEVLWHTSHMKITKSAMEDALANA